MTKPIQYSGPLATPIEAAYPPDPSRNLLMAATRSDADRARSSAERAAVDEWVTSVRGDRLAGLMQLFDIDPQADNAWFDLALALAMQHVPGMQVRAPVARPKRGRPVGWDRLRLRKLVLVVEAVRRTGPSGRREIRGAIAHITSNPAQFPDWQPPAGRTVAAWRKTLANKYSEGCRLHPPQIGTAPRFPGNRLMELSGSR